MCTKFNHWYLLAKENAEYKFGYEVCPDLIEKFTKGQHYFSNIKQAKKAKSTYAKQGIMTVILKRTCELMEI